MYNLKDFTYADAGKYLVGEKAGGICAPSSLGPFTERVIDISNLEVSNDYITFDNIRWINPGIHTYADAKKYIINKKYTNDAQIAIILNKDDSKEDALAYEKMQEWRAWASYFAHKIMEQIENKDV